MRLKWKRIESGLYEGTHKDLVFRVQKLPTAEIYGPNWKVTCKGHDWKEHALSKKDCYEYAEEFVENPNITNRYKNGN